MSVLLKICFGFLVCLPLLAQQGGAQNLSEASLEELLDVQVTSVSKKEQKLSRTGAAVFVLNAEDIRRSGATNIPDLLRLVPGVDVGRIDSHTWAISVRGLNNRYTNKVLVLIDGRSVYTPLTSGVNWDQQDVPLEDIDRIEVIRGPGGTVWGANAVSGVISITTKSAQATKGTLVAASGGSQEQHSLTQYGGKVGSGAYRVFGNYSNVLNSEFPVDSGKTGTAADGSHMLHGGFRSDWKVSPRDSVTVQGDISELGAGQTVSIFTSAFPYRASMNDKVTDAAANILGRWNRSLANGSEMSVQVYHDRYDRLESGLREIRDTQDLDFHHHLKAGERQDIVWGLGYRFTTDHITPGYSVVYTPDRKTDNLVSTFFQDEIRIADSVSLTVGAKLEHNGYTGFEYEPSVQLVWSPNARQEVWASAARAIRQPSRSDLSVHADIGLTPLPGGALGIVQLSGAAIKQAERAYDSEFGYRAQVSKHVSLDVATYLTFFHGLDTVEPGTPFVTTGGATPGLVIPFILGGMAHGQTYGGEIFANIGVTRHWRISPGYTLTHVKVGRDPGSLDETVQGLVANTPRNQFQVRSFLTLRSGVTADFAASYNGRLDHVGTAAGVIPGYTRLDARIAKKIGESWELSIVGQNLQAASHIEFYDSYGKLNTVVRRNVFARLVRTF